MSMHQMQKSSYLLSVKDVQQVLQSKVVEELTDTDVYTHTHTHTHTHTQINYKTTKILPFIHP